MPWHDWLTLSEFFAMIMAPCVVAYRVCKKNFDLDYGFSFDFDL